MKKMIDCPQAVVVEYPDTGEWVVSFSNHNPSDEECFICNTREDAFRLKERVDSFVNQSLMAAADYIRTLETLLFIHQQFGNNDNEENWLEDWQAFVDRQPDRPAFFAMLEENFWELPRRFRTARYQKWADTEQQTREENNHEL